MYWFLLSILPLALAAPSEYIIGGTTVSDPGRHPWQGSLLFLNGHTCGCVLLSSNYVLTAAHCTDGRTSIPSLFSVRFNSVYWSRGGDLYNVQSITNHPDYNDGSGGMVPHDVSVISPCQPITGMPVALDSTESGADCWISGWGVDTTGGGSIASQLNEADVQIMSNDECTSVWGESFRSDVQICVTSTNNDKGACNGDSGGPCVCNHGTRPELRGVTSWGRWGCYPTFPSVYARIYNSGPGTNLKPWICENAPDATGC